MGSQRIGFIGLGVMGLPMAGHLATAGHALTVYDLNQQVLARLRANHPGVAVAASPKDVGAASASRAAVSVVCQGSDDEVSSSKVPGAMPWIRPSGPSAVA